MSKPSNAKPQKPSQKPVATTVEPRIEIDGEVTRRIRQHARAHLKTEVCGVLIGDDLTGAIDIRASIEALTATQAGTHVTFTQDAWEEIYRVKDEQYPDDRIVGWYHSHPGFGVFLSDHDLFIQQNFFSSPGQVAWVYDPHTDEEGCFGWVNGEIRRLSSLQVMDRSGSSVDHSAKQLTSYAAPNEEDEEFEPRPQKSHAPVTMTTKLLRWSVTFLSYAAILVLGFALAFFFLPRYISMAIDPATGLPYKVDEQSLMNLLRHPPESDPEIKALPTPTPPPNQGSHP
jgi:proteasome lid subunit RPN8/RPN11